MTEDNAQSRSCGFCELIWPSDPKRRKKQIIATIVIAILIGGGVWLGMFLHDWPAHHFAEVKPGVLYRTGQPGAAGWRAIQDRHEIKTDVSVREIAPNMPWWQLEESFTNAQGIDWVIMPIEPIIDDPNGLPMSAYEDLHRKVLRFAEIVEDPERQPVLVHCEAGSIRTGVVVAGYRILVDNWTYEQALEEARQFRFRPESYRPYASYLKLLAAGKIPPDLGRKSSQPATQPSTGD